MRLLDALASLLARPKFKTWISKHSVRVKDRQLYIHAFAPGTRTKRLMNASLNGRHFTHCLLQGCAGIHAREGGCGCIPVVDCLKCLVAASAISNGVKSDSE